MEILSNILTFILNIGLGLGMLLLGGFVLIMIVILAGVLKDKSEEGTGSARDLANQDEKYHRARWNSDFSVSEKQYELISNKEKKYSGLEISKINTYKKPSTSDKDIKRFLKWASNKKSKNKESNLIVCINEPLKIVTPELWINCNFAIRTDGAFFCEDFNAKGFQISILNSYEIIFEFDNIDWVNLLTDTDVIDWHDKCNEEQNSGSSDLLSDSFHGELSYYLEDDSEFIPPEGEGADYWDCEFADSDVVDIDLCEEIDFTDEIFEINDEEFTFLKNERDHLIILLMASYTPSIMQSIIKETL